VPYPVQLRPVEHGNEDVLDYAILKLEEPVKGYKKPAFQMRAWCSFVGQFRASLFPP
jgi:hypothetical protein